MLLQTQLKKQRQGAARSCSPKHQWCLLGPSLPVSTVQISLGEVLWRAEVCVQPPTPEEPQRISSITLKAETKQHVPQVRYGMVYQSIVS